MLAFGKLQRRRAQMLCAIAGSNPPTTLVDVADEMFCDTGLTGSRRAAVRYGAALDLAIFARRHAWNKRGRGIDYQTSCLEAEALIRDGWSP